MSDKSPLDPSQELKALRTMATIIISALSQFPQDLSADQSLLQSPLSDPNQALSIAFRIEKKQLLLDAIRHLAAQIRTIEK